MQISAEEYERYSKEFNELRRARHEMGEEKYGERTFAGNDVVRMMAEELSDVANYCTYAFAKLMKLQELLEAQHPEAADDSFKGTKQGWLS